MFESQHGILDGHFHILFVEKIVIFVWKEENKWKRGWDGQFYKKEFLKGKLRPLLFLFSFVLFEHKVFRFYIIPRIRFWIVWEEGKHADHLTAATALKAHFDRVVYTCGFKFYECVFNGGTHVFCCAFWIRLFLHIYCRSGLNVTYLYVHAEILIDALDTLIGSSPPFIQHPIWEIWSSLEIQSWSSWAHYVHIILMTVDNKYQNGKQSAPCTWHNLNQPTKKFLLGGSHGLVVMGDN